MFGEVRLCLHSVWAFDDERDCIFLNRDPPTSDGLVVLWDKSGSMRGKDSEMKMIASALKCMTGTQGQFNLPNPTGGTALVDAVDATVAKQFDGVNKMLIVTDGEDTTSRTTQLVAGFVDGAPRMVDFPKLGGTIETTRARAAAVAAHLDHIGVDKFVVGVGKEVKHFIDACQKVGGATLVTAHIPTGATVEDVGAVMTTVMRRRPRRGQAGTQGTCTVVPATATPLGAEEVAAIARQADATTSAAERARDPSGPPFDAAAQAQYVAYIVESVAAKLPGCEAEHLHATVGWFRELLHQSSAPMAGALVGGQQWHDDAKGTVKGSVFAPPPAIERRYSWCGAIGRCIELLARNPEAVDARVPGLCTRFADEIRENMVGPVFREAGKPASCFAVTAEHLPEQLKHSVLYYKFKADTYVHYALNHRAASFHWAALRVGGLRVVTTGNSGPSKYGGPVITVEPAPTPAPSEASEAEASEVEDTESVAGSSSGASGYADLEEVSTLKRKVEVLEEANKKLKAVETENAALKLKLAAISAGFK